MTAGVLALPGTRYVPVPRLADDARVAEIISLARAIGNTPAAEMAVLRSVAHESLTGPVLWKAWKAAEGAVLILDCTDPGDPDHGMYAGRRDAAICVLMYGHRNGGTRS